MDMKNPQRKNPNPKEKVKGNPTVAKQLLEEKWQLDKMKEEFVATVSHELKTPIATVKNALRIIADKMADRMTEQETYLMKMADRNLTRLTKLVDNLLLMSKPGTGRVKLNVKNVDLGSLTEMVVDSFQRQAKSKSIQLTKNISKKLPVIIGDQEKLETALTNLVSNAIKFTLEGGNIKVSAKSDKKYIQISVKDTGIGISTQELEKIFDRFHQTKGASTTGVIGTGLGLAIVKALVEAHHGKISVESEEGKGTTFLIALPIRGCYG